MDQTELDLRKWRVETALKETANPDDFERVLGIILPAMFPQDTTGRKLLNIDAIQHRMTVKPQWQLEPDDMIAVEDPDDIASASIIVPDDDDDDDDEVDFLPPVQAEEPVPADTPEPDDEQSADTSDKRLAQNKPLTEKQRDVLNIIIICNDFGVYATVKEIAKRHDTIPQNISPVLKALTAKGHITQKQIPTGSAKYWVAIKDSHGNAIEEPTVTQTRKDGITVTKCPKRYADGFEPSKSMLGHGRTGLGA